MMYGDDRDLIEELSQFDEEWFNDEEAREREGNRRLKILGVAFVAVVVLGIASGTHTALFMLLVGALLLSMFWTSDVDKRDRTINRLHFELRVLRRQAEERP